jgi:hypothetical protein
MSKSIITILFLSTVLNSFAQKDSVNQENKKHLIYTITVAPSYCWRKYIGSGNSSYYNGKPEYEKPSLGYCASFTLGKKLKKVELHFGLGVVFSNYKGQFSTEAVGNRYDINYTYQHQFLSVPFSVVRMFGKKANGYIALDLEPSYLFGFKEVVNTKTFDSSNNMIFQGKQVFHFGRVPTIWVGGELGYVLKTFNHLKLASTISVKCTTPIAASPDPNNNLATARSRVLLDSSLNLKLIF